MVFTAFTPLWKRELFLQAVKPSQIRWIYEVPPYMFLQYCVHLLPNENSIFAKYSMNYIIAWKKKRDPETFPINAVVVSGPPASFTSHFQRHLHTRRFFWYLTSPNFFPFQAIMISGVSRSYWFVMSTYNHGQVPTIMQVFPWISECHGKHF